MTLIEYLTPSHLYYGYSDLTPVDEKYQSKAEVKIARSETLLRQGGVEQTFNDFWVRLKKRKSPNLREIFITKNQVKNISIQKGYVEVKEFQKKNRSHLGMVKK